MNFRSSHLFLAACLIVLIWSPTIGGSKIGERLEKVLRNAGPNDKIVAWVYLTDKGSGEMMKTSVPREVVSERSIQRRLNVRSAAEVVDYTDLLPEQHYVEQLSAHVRRIRQLSKWFNAVSVEATKSQITVTESLPFVREIELVARFKRNRTEDEISAVTRTTEPETPPPIAKGSGIDYGASLGQLKLINVPAVHDLGNYGQGVLIGVFDNGFRLPSHESFASMSILATRDFVDHKTSVVPNNPSTAFGSHGVNTLSTIGGYKPGQLVGPAFGATFILARTENDSSETPIEEDNWVAAIEWADSLGVQVTSTSLGYLDYDQPYKSWTYLDMNGNTTVITRAADLAVRKGILVVNSAGNEGFNATHNTLVAPADGDSVIAVGAVDAGGARAPFSSVGPTTSNPPRIKPDIMAPGASVRVASSTDSKGYYYSSGTSFACPLAAGVAALILHAHPNATPVQVANALRSTASRANSPDNSYGWGIINALDAANALGSTDTGEDLNPTQYTLVQNYPNPFNPATNIQFSIVNRQLTIVKVYDALGREVSTLVNEVKEPGTYAVQFDASGLASGVYFYRLQAGNFVSTRKMVVMK